MTITPTAGLTQVPGLTLTMNIPDDADVIVASNGGLFSTQAGAKSTTDIELTVDGSLVSNGGFRRVTAAADGTPTYWAINQQVALAPGTHTLAIQARGVGAGSGTSQVAGDSTSVLQGDLTVTVLKH